MNLDKIPKVGTTITRKRFWDKARDIVLSLQKKEGRNVSVDERQGLGTVINVTREPGTVATGACCRDGICTIETQASCESDGGEYQGDDTVCDPNPCGGCELPHLGSLSVHIELSISCDCSVDVTCCDCAVEGCGSSHDHCNTMDADIEFDCTWTWAHPAEECQSGFCDCGSPEFDQTDGCSQITDCVGSTIFGITPCDLGLCSPYGTSNAGGSVRFFGATGPKFGASINVELSCCDTCPVTQSFATDLTDWGGIAGTYVATGSGDCGETGSWSMTATLVAS